MRGIRILDNVVEVEVGVDVAAHAAADVVFQPIELPNITNDNGCAVITSITVTDYDDQGAALNILFLRQPVVVGANNATMAIPDTQIQHVLGHEAIAAGNYLDLDQNQVATATNCGLVVRPDPSRGNSVWMTANTPGTPTYAGGRLTIKVGVLRG